MGPGEDEHDLWTGAPTDPLDVQRAYAAMNEQERDLAAARRRAASALTSVARSTPRRTAPRPRPPQGARPAAGRASPRRDEFSREARLRRDAAATLIQSNWRGALGRDRAYARWVAIHEIQRFWRGALARRDAQRRRDAIRAREEAKRREREELDARADEIERIAAAVRASRERRSPGRDPRLASPPSPLPTLPPAPAEPRDRLAPRVIFPAVSTPNASTPPARAPRPNKNNPHPNAVRPDSAYVFDAGVDDFDELPDWATPSKVRAEDRTRDLFVEIDEVLAGSKLTRHRLTHRLEANRARRNNKNARGMSISPSLTLTSARRESESSSARSVDVAERDRSRHYSAEFAELASASARSSCSNVNAREDGEMDAISRYAAALAAMTTTTTSSPSSPSSPFASPGGSSRRRSRGGSVASSPAVRSELLPAVRPVSARRGNANVSVGRPDSGASARSSASNAAAAAAARRRMEEVQAEEDRAFEEKLARMEARYREEKARGDAARRRMGARPGRSLDDTAAAFEEERVESDRGAGSGMGKGRRVEGGIGRERSRVVFRPAHKIRQTPPAVLPLWSPDANKGGGGGAQTHPRSLRGRAEESRASRRRLQVA